MFLERRNRRRVRDLVEISGFLEVAIEQLEKLEKETLSEIGSYNSIKQPPPIAVKVKEELIKKEDMDVSSISSQLSGAFCLDTSLGPLGNAGINEPNVCLEEQGIKKEIILPEEGNDQNRSSFQDHFSFGTAGVALDCLIQRTSTSQSSSDMGGPTGTNLNRLSSDISSPLGINMNCEFSNPTETSRLRSGSEKVRPSGINMNCGFYNPTETSRLCSDISGPSTGNGNSGFGNPKTNILSSDIVESSEMNMNCKLSNTSRLSSEIAGPSGINMNFREITSHPAGKKNNQFSNPSETNIFSSDSAGHSVVNKNSGFSNSFETFRFSNPERFRSDIASDHSTVNKNSGFSNPSETNIFRSVSAGYSVFNTNSGFSNPSESNIFRSVIAGHSVVNKNSELSDLEIHNINNPKKNTSAQPSSYKSIENDDETVFKVLIKFKTNLTPQEIAHILKKNGITDIQDIFIHNLTKAYITFSKKEQFMITSILGMENSDLNNDVMSGSLLPGGSQVLTFLTCSCEGATDNRHNTGCWFTVNQMVPTDESLDMSASQMLEINIVEDNIPHDSNAILNPTNALKLITGSAACLS